MDQHKFHSIEWYPKGVENVCTSFWARVSDFYFFGFRGFVRTQLKNHGPVYHTLCEKLSGPSSSHQELCTILESEYSGRIPLRIWAARENNFYDGENILVRVEATDPRFVFLPDLLIPTFIRAIWYPSTVATLAAKYSSLLRRLIIKTSDVEPEFSELMIYGFGQRSASSNESCILGGAAFLQFFKYSDVSGAREWLAETGSGSVSEAAHKIFALDHGRFLLLEKTISQNPAKFLNSVYEQFEMLSLPVDSTSLEELGGTLREMVRQIPRDKMLVLRWDGSAFNHVIPQLIEILKVAGEPKLNAKGFLTWNKNLHLMFTENMTMERVEEVLNIFTRLGYAADGIRFGIGTQMIQSVTRDDYGVVGKITAAHDGQAWFDIAKTSLDHPSKRGLSGRLSVANQNGKWLNERSEFSSEFELLYDGSTHGIL